MHNSIENKTSLLTGTNRKKLVISSLALCALCSLVLAVSAPTTQAAEPRQVSIVIHDFVVADDAAVGTFESTGALETSGLESQVYRVPGKSLQLHCVQTLTTAEGTIVIHSQCNMETNVGVWRVVSGTGAYAGLRGNGSLVMTLDPNDPTGGFEILDGRLY